MARDRRQRLSSWRERAALVALASLCGCSNLNDAYNNAVYASDEDAGVSPEDVEDNGRDTTEIQCGESGALCDGMCVNTASVNHCGGCDPCVPGPNSRSVSCVEGVCGFTCELAFVDVNGDQARGVDGDGCECLNLDGEICDGLDNDCDELIDEGVDNVCGGCRAIEGDVGENCGEAGCEGTLQCDGLERLICQSDGNPCGGCAELVGELGAPCEGCGSFECDGPDALTCVLFPATFYEDRDQDSYGTDNFEELCEAVFPFTALRRGDCDDGSEITFPGADEVCDGDDNNCNGEDDEGVLNDCGGCAVLVGAPGDVCGGGACEEGELVCDGLDRLECDGPGLNECGGCTVLDDSQGDPCGDCGEFVCDEEAGVLQCVEQRQTFFIDVDDDTFGGDSSMSLCAPDGDFTALRSGDCNDDDRFINPDAIEICDGVDNNCNDQTDTDLILSDCPLQNGVCQGARQGCEQGRTIACDNDRYAAHAQNTANTFDPDDETICDEADNNCSGASDELCCDEAVVPIQLEAPQEAKRRVQPTISLGPEGEAFSVAYTSISPSQEMIDDQAAFAPGQFRLGLMSTAGTSLTDVFESPFESTSRVSVNAYSGGGALVVLDSIITVLTLNRLDTLVEQPIISTESIERNVLQFDTAFEANGNGVIVYSTKSGDINTTAIARVVLDGDTTRTTVDAAASWQSPSVSFSPAGQGIVAGLSMNNRISWRTFDQFPPNLGTVQNQNEIQPGDIDVATSLSGVHLIIARGARNLNGRIGLHYINPDGEHALSSVIAEEALVGSAQVLAMGDEFIVVYATGDTVLMRRFTTAGQQIGGVRTLVAGNAMPRSAISLSAGPARFNNESRWFALALADAQDADPMTPPDEQVSIYTFNINGDRLCFTD